MSEILTSLPELAGGETQLLVLGGLFFGILMVTLGAALALADRDNVGRRLALAQGDNLSRGEAGRVAAAELGVRPCGAVAEADRLHLVDRDRLGGVDQIDRKSVV